MASTYTTNLGIEKIATGEQSGTWGDTTNTNLDLIDEAVNGVIAVTLSSAGSSGSPTALPITDGASSNGRNKFIEFVDGGDLGGTAYVQLTPNNAEKVVHIRNSLSSSRSVIVFQGTYNASNDFEIVNGADVLLKFDGAGTGATVTDVNVDLTVTGATIATADINGGTIDGAVIGGASAAAGTFTTFTSTGIDDNATSTALTVTDSGIAATLTTAAQPNITSVGTLTGFTSTGIDDNANATAITIDASENVGIGTDGTIGAPLHVKGTSSTGVAGYQRLQNNTGNTGYTGTFFSVDPTYAKQAIYAQRSLPNGGGSLIFAVDSSTDAADVTIADEKMRLDSSGNLLVGKTSTSFTIAGVRVRGDFPGIIEAASANSMLVLNRLTTDGDMATLYKDGTTVGSIGVASSELYFSSGNTGLYFDDANNLIRPTNSAGALRDNIVDLGASNSRFDDIYATNGTIQTSDANEKQDIEALSEAETRVAVAAKGLLRKFRWKSAVEEKGDDARVHFGIIAQDLKAAFEAEGLDAGRYAMFIHSTWTDEETGEERSRMGVRYSELLAFIIAAI